MSVAYVGLGSNLGDRLASLRQALARLGGLDGCRVASVSGIYESEPVGGPPGQRPYLNAVARLDTDCRAGALLGMLQSIERELGRQAGPRWGPRPIDLDLLLFDDLVVDSPELVLPHPRMAERPFVLAPLAELAPELVHPAMGRPIRELLEACTARKVSGLRRWADWLTPAGAEGGEPAGHGPGRRDA